MNPGIVKAALGLLQSLVKPLLILFGLRKAKQAGRKEAVDEQARESLENQNDALSDRIEAERAADSASDDELAGLLLDPQAGTPRDRE